MDNSCLFEGGKYGMLRVYLKIKIKKMNKKILTGMVIFISCLFTFSGVQAVDIKGYDLEIILDSSGSMAENLSGKSKMNIAKEAIQSVINEVPDSTFIGFRAYGHQSGTAAKNCTDTQVIVPIGAINKSDFMSRVNALTPRGWTPIDYSLRQAQNDFVFKSEYGKMIILVSDGEETCGGDPCQAVKDLKLAGFAPIVNTVGFSVGAVAREQLKCIAAATGGEYKDASNASELIESMRIFSKRAFESYKPSGNVVPGKGFGDAPLVTPGIYGGDLLTDESKFYKFKVKKGQKVTISASVKKEKAINSPDIYTGDRCTCMVPILTAYGSDMSQVGIKKGDRYKYNNPTYLQSINGADDVTREYCIRPEDVSPKPYSFSYDVAKAGEEYVSISIGWLEACSSSTVERINSEVKNAEKDKQNMKAFYDVKITVEGEGELEPVAVNLSNKLLDSGDNTQTNSSSAASGNNNSFIIWVAAVVILAFGVISAIAVFIIKRKNQQNQL